MCILISLLGLVSMTKIAKNFLTQTRPRRLIKMHIKEYLNLSELWKWSLWSTGCARQDKTRQDKTRQDKTRQDKTRQDKTRQDKTRQDKTRQDKTRQDKTRQDKTRQDKTRQDKTRQDKTRQDKTRQDKTRQDKTRQDKTRQDKKQSLTDAMSMTSMWLKLFIIKLNKGKFTDVPWQKGAPFFCYNVPRQRKDSLRRY